MLTEQARAWNFDDIVHEGLSLIPAYAPDWTNYNASDPGITLVELLAYISEILVYRALRVTPDAKFNFLRLLGYHGDVPLQDLIGRPSHVIEEAIRARVEEMSWAENGVTSADFEALAGRILIRRLGEGARFRVKCWPGVDVRRMVESRGLTAVESPGDVSVLIALEPTAVSGLHPGLLRELQEQLQQHSPLTMRAQVAPAVELHLSVACSISPRPGATLADAIEAVDAALHRHFDPLGPDDAFTAGPFGRTLHLASVAGVIDDTEDVDFVEDVVVLRLAISDIVREEEAWVGIRIGKVARIGEDTRMGGRASTSMRRFQTESTGEAESIALYPWEVIRVRLAHDAVLAAADDGFSGETGNRRRG
jgi:hypothetical protein